MAKLVAMNASLPMAVSWIASLVTGPLGTGIGILAVASLGLAALGGRLSPARTARVLLGLFILFGAPQIAAGLVKLFGERDQSRQADVAIQSAPAERPHTICWTC